MRSPTLSHESDSEEVGYLGVLELKIVFKKFKLSSRSRKSEFEKSQGPSLMVDERKKSVWLIESKQLHQLD